MGNLFLKKMKFITFTISEKTKLIILAIISCIMLSGISCANLNQHGQSIPSIMERISAGDLTEKEIVQIYTKNYKPELEYHEIFQSCISHLFTQKKKTSSSMLSKIFFGFEKIVSNPNKLQFPDMGLKVDCEVYLTRILANDYREKKINEKNPINEKINELKLKIQNLNERYDNLAVQSLLQRRENKMKSSGINVTSTSSTTSTTRRTTSGGSTSSRTTTAGGSLSDSTRSIINGGSISSTTNGGSTSSSTTTIKGGGSSSTTLDINSIVPTYTETDGEIDVGDFNRIIATMKTLLAASSEKYNTLDSQYQKNLKALTILKAIYGSGKDKECDCDKKLKTCEVNLTQYNTQINTLNITIISLRQQLTECRNNPPKGDCDGLKEELKKEQE